MGEAEAAVLRIHENDEILADKESVTTEEAQIDLDLEVPQSEIRPSRITMNIELLKAARSGDKSILDKLLRSEDFSSDSVGDIAIIMDDAATRKDTSCLLGVTREGNTALHIVASRGYLVFAEKICFKERSLLVAPNTKLDTPLHCAARAGNDKMVSLIIKFAKEDRIEATRVLRATNKTKANALHEAAQYGHVNVAEVLMEEDAGLASMLNDAGMSPLYLAIMTGSSNVAKSLLQSTSWKNASPASYTGPNKTTALHIAVHLNQDIVQDLLRLKPMLARHVDSSGRIPLHYAASSGYRDTVKLLLENDSSTAYLSDANGSFPIHHAAGTGNIDAVDQILKQCPDTDELLDMEGKNFLHLAFKYQKSNLVRKIISKRSDLRRLLNDQDSDGNTPLHTAIKNSDQGSVYFLLQDKSVHSNIINHDGFTPLDLAYASEGLTCPMNVAACIVACLIYTKALFSPRALHYLKMVELSNDGAERKPLGDNKFKESHQEGDDKFEEISSSNEANEIKKELNLSKNLGIASVLVATVTFAAGFTLPGGYIADHHPGRGTAALAKEYAFKVFLVSDAFALVCSIMATCWLLYAGTSTVDRYTRGWVRDWAIVCLYVAFVGMSTAFAMGVYVALAPSCKRVSILVCIIALATPFLAFMVAGSNMYAAVRTVIIRQGWPTVHPYVKKRLPFLPRKCLEVIMRALLVIFVQAMFFLLAMLS